MQKVALVTDTASDVPEDLCRELGISLAPVHVITDAAEYRDRVDISVEEVLRSLEAGERVTTSGANVEDWVAAFEQALAIAESVVCVTIPPELSVTYRAALTARELLADRDITVVDSRSVLVPEGLAVVQGARAARAGKGKEEVLAVIQDVLQRSQMVFTADTIKYMKLGGRLASMEAVVGSLEGYRPIFRIIAKGFLPIDKAPDRRSSLERLLQLMEEDLRKDPFWRPGCSIRAAVDHILAPDAAELRDEIQRRFRCRESFIWSIGPVAAVHLGPGVIGMGYHVVREGE